MQYTIYQASAQHAQILNDIHYKSWMVCYRGMLDDDFLDTMESLRWINPFQKMIGESLYAAVLETDGRPAGCVTYRLSDQPYDNQRTGEIVSFYFLPDFWGEGIAAPLMQWVLTELKQMGCIYASLWVLEQNQRAQRFYKKMGFLLTSELLYSNMGRQKTTEFRMIKAL